MVEGFSKFTVGLSTFVSERVAKANVSYRVVMVKFFMELNQLKD